MEDYKQLQNILEVLNPTLSDCGKELLDKIIIYAWGVGYNDRDFETGDTFIQLLNKLRGLKWKQ